MSGVDRADNNPRATRWGVALLRIVVMPKIRLCFGLLVGVLLTGCGQTTLTTTTLRVPAGNPPLAVDISNFRGSVELRGEPRAKEITVDAKVHVDSGVELATRDAYTQMVNVESTVDQTEGGAVLRVKTTSQREQFDDHWVHLYIVVPYIDGVRIDNRGPMNGFVNEGDVEVVNAGGAHHITNRKGAIEVRTSRPITDPVQLTNVDGNIYYQVPLGSTGRFDMETLEGECAFKDKSGTTDETYSTRSMLQTTLAQGDNDVVCRTNLGDIRVWVRDDALDYTRVIKKSPPDIRSYMNLEGSRRYTRNLPEDTPRHSEVNERSYD